MATIKRAPSGHRCGESHQRAKLSDEIVREMRKVYQSWVAQQQAGHLGAPKGYRTLGAIFGCPWPTARDIVTYRTRISA